MRLRPTCGWLLAAAALAACAHSPGVPSPRAAPETKEHVWPAAPAAPQVRWAASLPGEILKPPRPSPWRRVLHAVLGTEARTSRDALFARPFGVAIAGDEVVVADPDGPRVQAIDWRRGTSRPIACDGRGWQMPMAVATSSDGTWYVADGGEIVRIPKSGACSVFGAPSLDRPTGIAVSGDRLFVVDPPGHAVVVFSPEGREVLRFGGRGESSGELNFPTGVAAEPSGTVLVVDSLNFRVSRFSREGRHLVSFGEPGLEGSGFARPKAVAVGAGGRIYVSDSQRGAVLVFDGSGSFLYAIESAHPSAGVALPGGLAVGDGFLYVTDPYERRIQIYELLGEIR